MEQPSDFIVFCPHCFMYVLIEKLNCAIFCHGILKSNGKQIDPHSSKELCEFYVEKDLIYGCGKPFQITTNNQENERLVAAYPVIIFRAVNR